MKTIKRIFAVAFVAMCTQAFNACIEEAAPILPEDGTLVEMTFEASVVETKAAFDGKRINWEVGDKVAIYDGTAKREFTVQSVSGSVASITGPVAADATEFYAVTPYSAAREALPSEGKVYFNLPTEQTLAPGKDFDEDAFVAVGQVEGTRISFQNVVSLLKINIPENITSVSLKGFNSENIAGAANAAVTPTVTGGTETSVVLKPVGETFTAGTHYIALLPSTFTNGFKVVYADNDNKISIKKNTGNVVFPVNDGFDITAYTTADKLTTWIPNPLMNEGDLLYFVENQAAYAGETAKLGQDIALTKQWTPVDLTGTLDGQGYTISGLNVNTGNGGLFVTVKEAAILKNLTVAGTINSVATTHPSNVGLVGYLHGLLYDVVNQTNITASSAKGRVYLGGLAGIVKEGGVMIDCENAGSVTLNSTLNLGEVGGLVGVLYNGTVQGGVNSGTVTSSAEATKLNSLGGIVGYHQGGVLESCVNKGNIVVNSGTSDTGIGGVVGYYQNYLSSVASIHECVNEGKMEINFSSARAVGGLVGVFKDGGGSSPTAAEITECVNKTDISVAVSKAAGSYSEGTTGYDGFYLGGVVGSIMAANSSEIVNKITANTNLGNISATLASSASGTQSVKVGGICGNTRGPIVLIDNENKAESVTLENSLADYILCAAGGIVGEYGDPWTHENSTPAQLQGNVNRAYVLSKTNAQECPAGGVIGYVFDPVTLVGNKNFGDVERALTDGASPALEWCFSGGIVGLFSMSDDARLIATFDGDMSFGTIRSAGRAGIIFGGMRSDTHATFTLNNCGVGGRLVTQKPVCDVVMNEENWDDMTGSLEGGYLWGLLLENKYALTLPGSTYGDATSNSGAEQLTAWQQGYMDIHHISTGRGNCTFMILPDGTTMMVDAGDNGPSNDDGTKLDRVPNESLTPAEWIVRYVSHFMGQASLPVKLDHMLVSHFHYDHVGVGTTAYPYSPDGQYLMTGVPYVGSTLEVDNFVDRAYPNYDFPYTGYFDKGVFRDYTMMENYLKFLVSGYNRLNNMSGFEVGSSDQFALKSPRSDFAIRNVYANGQLWTGSGVSSESIVPSGLTQAELQGAENQWSAVLNISYGNFDYHTGGDINGTQLFDAECKVAARIGETDVFHCNHHACDDSMRADVLIATNPQVFVVPAWEKDTHPGAEALSRMAGYGKVFMAAPATKDRVESNGHVVVRVYEGGNEFQIFVLNDRSTEYEVIHKTDIITSRN